VNELTKKNFPCCRRGGNSKGKKKRGGARGEKFQRGHESPQKSPIVDRRDAPGEGQQGGAAVQRA